MVRKSNLAKMTSLTLGTVGILGLTVAVPIGSSAFADTSSSPVSLQKRDTDKSTFEVKNLTLHVGDNWSEFDNITGVINPDGEHVAWDVNLATSLGELPQVTTANAEGILSNGKVIGPGRFTVTYWFGVPEKSVSSTVTVIPVVNLTAKDSTIYTTDHWNPEDNFTGGTEDGSPIDFSKVKVTGTVDTTKAGTYPITYSYYDTTTTINVTVKTDQTTITAIDLTLHVGDTWNVYDNITGYIDKDGVHHSWDFNDHSYINAGGFNTELAPEGDPSIWNPTTSKFIRPGYYIMIYHFNAAPEKYVRARVTVLP